MPFGSDPFRDNKALSLMFGRVFKCHQCLSAVIPFGTLNLAGQGHMVQPRHQCLSAVIPFGTKSVEFGYLSFGIHLSPMPFGSDPFRDRRNRAQLA